MKRLIHQLQESLGIKQKVDQELLADMLIHCISSEKTLEESYKILVETFGVEYMIDIDIMKRVAQQKETVMLIDNDRAISLWARLISTYKEHIRDPDESKVTSIELNNDLLRSILIQGADTKGKYKSAFSRARNAINDALPVGVNMICQVHKDCTKFIFISAINNEVAHNLLVQVGCTTLSTIDKVIAQMRFYEEAASTL